MADQPPTQLAVLQSLATTTKKRVVARRLLPLPETDLSLLSLLESCDVSGEDLDSEVVVEQSLVTAWHARCQACLHAAQLGQTPILAVCGTVNSGKSTIVSSLLSEKEQPRVLIGELSEEGTHRFVFWLPAAWKTSGLDRAIWDLIRSATGSEPELLSDNPVTAAAQYNARHDRLTEFNIPLIAYDAGLDSAGIALLDCPDIQRSLDENSVEFSSSERLKRLRSIAPLCSAFVVVASMQQAGADDLGRVFTALDASAPDAPLYFVLNMTKTADADRYRIQAEQVLQRWKKNTSIRRMYFAPFEKTESPDGRVHPDVISLDSSRSRLIDLKTELDPAQLQVTHLHSCVTHLQRLIVSTRKKLTESTASKSEKIRRLREKICQFIAGKFLTDQDGLRALHFTEAALRLAESLRRTAPLSIRLVQAPGAWLQGTLKKFKIRQATPKDDAKYTSIKPNDFADALLGHRSLPPATTEEALTRVWKNAWDATLAAPQPAFDNPALLDRMTSEMWRAVPRAQKWTLFRNLLLALAGFAFAGMLAPLDGGITLVVWTKAHIILGGWEIMALLVGAPLIAMLASIPAANNMVSRLENDVAMPQISFLYAGLCDGLGMPRYLDGFPVITGSSGKKILLQTARLDPLPVVIPILSGDLIRLDVAQWASLENDLANLQS